MNSFNYLKVSSTEEAVSAIDGQIHYHFLAGGTNLIDRWKYDLLHPDTLIDVNGLAALKTIESTEKGLRLGALATNADTAHHPLVQKHYPLLAHTILAGASAQIRNAATNGGNLLQRTRCYYFYDPDSPCNKRNPGSGCPAVAGHNRLHAVLGHSDQCIAVFPSDMCVALAALEATVNVVGPRGERTIAFADFHRLPGDTPELDNNLQADELITSIDLPREGFADHYSYLKLRDRSSYAFALVSVATGLRLEEGKITKARIALGGVAHQPWRVPAAEEYLIGKTPTDDHFATAAGMIMLNAVGFEHNRFKIPLAKQAIIRNCRMALEPEVTQLPGAPPSL